MNVNETTNLLPSPPLTPSTNTAPESANAIENVQKVAYGVISVLSLLGNTLVILYFIQGRRILLKKPFNVNIVALSVTDTVTGILLFFTPGAVFATPFVRTTNTISVTLYCQVMWERKGLFLFGFASMYLSVLLTVDRWIAVVKPTRYKQLVTVKRVGIGIVLSFAIATTIVLQNQPALRIKPDNPPGQQCHYAKKTAEDLARGVIMGYIGFTFKFCVPVTLILAMYIHIIYTMRASHSVHLHEGHATIIIKRVTTIAAIISLTLIICWIPNQINYFLFLVGKVPSINNIKHKIFVLLAMSNSCWNPLLYGFASREYRKGYWEVLTRRCPCLKSNRRIGDSSAVSAESASGLQVFVISHERRSAISSH